MHTHSIKVTENSVDSLSITQYLEIKYPIIQAPMNDITTPELVASVSNTGGMGCIAGGYINAIQLEKQIIATQKITDKPFAVNLLIENAKIDAIDIIPAMKQMTSICDSLNIDFTKFYGESNLVNSVPRSLPDLNEKINCLIQQNVKVVILSGGIPKEPILLRLKQAGIKIIGVATHLLEVILWESKEVKTVILQGLEAGGCRATFIGNPIKVMQPVNALISQVKRYLPKTKIIAAGGIMNGKGILAAQIIGADAVMMGTAFLCSEEAASSSSFRKILSNANELDSMMDPSWHGKYARVLKNTALKTLQKIPHNCLAPFPSQYYLTFPLHEYGEETMKSDYLCISAGIGFAECVSDKAANLITCWINEVNQLKRNLFNSTVDS